MIARSRKARIIAVRVDHVPGADTTRPYMEDRITYDWTTIDHGPTWRGEDYVATNRVAKGVEVYPMAVGDDCDVWLEQPMTKPALRVYETVLFKDCPASPPPSNEVSQTGLFIPAPAVSVPIRVGTGIRRFFGMGG